MPAAGEDRGSVQSFAFAPLNAKIVLEFTPFGRRNQHLPTAGFCRVAARDELDTAPKVKSRSMDSNSIDHRVSRRSFLLGASGAAAAAALAGCGKKGPSAEEIRMRADALGKQHGVQIGYGNPTTFFVSPFAEKDAAIAGAVISPAKEAAIPRALDALEKSLSVYPVGFVPSVVRAIFLCDSISFGGAEAASANGPLWLILAVPSGKGSESIYESVRPRLHHELSSLIWNRSQGLRTRWQGLIPKDWAPAANQAEALKSATRGDGALAQGFLSPYGATTAENDFNTYAEIMLDSPKRVADLAAGGNVTVRDKAALLMAYYAQIDPRMKAVFATLGLGGIPAAAPIDDSSNLSRPAVPKAKSKK